MLILTFGIGNEVSYVRATGSATKHSVSTGFKNACRSVSRIPFYCGGVLHPALPDDARQDLRIEYLQRDLVALEEIIKEHLSEHDVQ